MLLWVKILVWICIQNSAKHHQYKDASLWGLCVLFWQKSFVQTLKLDYQHLPAISKDWRESRHLLLKMQSHSSIPKFQMELWAPLAALIITGRDQCTFQPLCNNSAFPFSYERTGNATADHGKGDGRRNYYSGFSLESAMCLVKHSRAMGLSVSRTVPYQNTWSFFSKISTKTSPSLDNSVYNY